MANRTASASGTIRNTGDGTATFKARLWTQVFDANDISKIFVSTDSPGVSLAPGATSSQINLSHAEFLAGGWRMNAWVTLDITSPVAMLAVASTPQVPFTESYIYGGTWVVTPTPTISARPIQISFAFAYGSAWSALMERFREALLAAGLR